MNKTDSKWQLFVNALQKNRGGRFLLLLKKTKPNKVFIFALENKPFHNKKENLSLNNLQNECT